jgi:hypothetical protein
MQYIKIDIPTKFTKREFIAYTLLISSSFLSVSGLSLLYFRSIKNRPCIYKPLLDTKVNGGLELSMSRSVITVLGFFLVFYSMGCASMPISSKNQPNPHNPNEVITMRVLWTVSEYKKINIAVMNEDEARRMLFKPLDIGDTYITFDGKTCRNVIFKRETVKIEEYLHHTYNIMPQVLNIDDGVVDVIRTNCELPGFAEYIRLKDRRLIIYIKGVFFFFEPAVTY